MTRDGEMESFRAHNPEFPVRVWVALPNLIQHVQASNQKTESQSDLIDASRTSPTQSGW